MPPRKATKRDSLSRPTRSCNTSSKHLFIYEDTPDQIKSTAEVKADMERERPMDRLICGDVGFGKTEIAIRAAFKASLRQQAGRRTRAHHRIWPSSTTKTFSERLKEFPVQVFEYLSRARTAGTSQSQTSRKASPTAESDIIIGTHTLDRERREIQRPRDFSIVDEEQKFGVAVKEKLKQMKVNVDTLTMSATPIPRTLQFSLMGARDLSAITTPPPNRSPDPNRSTRLQRRHHTRRRLTSRLSRGGQVFIVNNRIPQLYELERHGTPARPGCTRRRSGTGRCHPEELEQAIYRLRRLRV